MIFRSSILDFALLLNDSELQQGPRSEALCPPHHCVLCDSKIGRCNLDVCDLNVLSATVTIWLQTDISIIL
jgi:hypothetical protein